MMEGYRVFGNIKFWCLCLLTLALNLALFWQTQENSYGIQASQSGATKDEYIEEYQRQLKEYQGMEILDVYGDCKEKREQSGWSEWDGYQLSDNVRDTLLFEQIEYLYEYPDYLDTIKENAKKLNSISLFAKESEFSSRNIKKTVNDFSAMDDVTVELGNFCAVTEFLEYSLTDYFLLILIFALVLSLQEESQNGMRQIVRATPKGRGSLAIKRWLLLLGFVILATSLFFLLVLGFACAYFGAPNWEAAVQSVILFQKYPVSGTVGEVIAEYIGMKMLAMVLLAEILWVVVSCVSEIPFAALIIGLIGGGEYLFYSLIPVQSAFNFLKGFNLFSLLNLKNLYTDYLNVNLFGYPINVREWIQRLLPWLVFIFSVLVIGINTYKNMEKKNTLFARLYDKWLRCCDRLQGKKHLAGFEYHRWMVHQKSAVILLILVLLLLRIYPVNQLEQTEYRDLESYYLNMWTGPIGDPEMEAARKAEMEQLEERATWYQEMEGQHAEGLVSDEELQIASMLVSDVASKQRVNEKIQERVEQLSLLHEEEGLDVWLLDDERYEVLFGEKTSDAQRVSGLIAGIFLCLVLSSVYHQEAGEDMILRATSKGRWRIALHKQSIALVAVILVGGLCYGMEYISKTRLCPSLEWGAAIQSIPELTGVSWNLTIGQYFAMIYGLKILTLWSLSQSIVWVSCLVKNKRKGLFITISVLVLPAILWIMGLDVMQKLNYVWCTGAAEVVRKADFSMNQVICIYGSVVCLGIAMAIVSSGKWSITKAGI